MDEKRIIPGPGYSIEYHGGRLADVMIDGTVIECPQVRRYDTATGAFGPEPTDDEIRSKVAAFIDEAGGLALYIDNCIRYG